MAYIYGPVPSWRLGRSLGIDLLSTADKTCPFECVYCQLGRTIHKTIKRKEFIPFKQLSIELEEVKGTKADYTTFSGRGEPTLASNLGQAIKLVKKTLDLPTAVLTNSSLLSLEEVRSELLQADVVVAKLDASNEEIFQRVNKPISGLHLKELINGILQFREQYRGKLAIQIMFVEANKDFAKELVRIVSELSPDEVQINTPLRPCQVKPLPPEEISVIYDKFSSLKNVINVYMASKLKVNPFNLLETRWRRPEF